MSTPFRVIVQCLAAVLAVAAGVAPAFAQRTYVVGSSATYPPFAYENAQKQIVGFDVDVINVVV